MFGDRDIAHDRFQASSVHLSRRIGNVDRGALCGVSSAQELFTLDS
jgi:hypothetical protein